MSSRDDWGWQACHDALCAYLRWESANIFLHLTSGESLKVKTVTKWQGWWKVHPKEERR